MPYIEHRGLLFSIPISHDSSQFIVWFCMLYSLMSAFSFHFYFFCSNQLHALASLLSRFDTGKIFMLGDPLSCFAFIEGSFINSPCSSCHLLSCILKACFFVVPFFSAFHRTVLQPIFKKLKRRVALNLTFPYLCCLNKSSVLWRQALPIFMGFVNVLSAACCRQSTSSLDLQRAAVATLPFQ